MAQSYPCWELLITDDCSKDDSVDVIRKFTEQDSRIKLFVLPHNSGAAVARNNSIRNARGKYIAFLDSDDVWRPDKLEKQLEFMKRNHYAFTMTDYELMDVCGNMLGKVLHMPCSMSYRQYLRNTAIGCLTVMIDREQTGSFEMPIIRTSQDMALWLQIMKRGFKIYALNEVLAIYRQVPYSNSAKKWNAIKDVWKVYRQIERLNMPYAMFNFCGYALHAVLKRMG